MSCVLKQYFHIIIIIFYHYYILLLLLHTITHPPIQSGCRGCLAWLPLLFLFLLSSVKSETGSGTTGLGRLLPGSSSSLIGRQSHPSDTGHVPPGKQTLLHDALDRNTVDDITAATLSSPNPWPPHCWVSGKRNPVCVRVIVRQPRNEWVILQKTYRKVSIYWRTWGIINYQKVK